MFIDGAEEATIGQYANYGPNNEVYLAQGQAISFKVPENDKIASIQIGAKTPNGAATMVVEGKVSTTTRLEQQLNTATEMYYNITEQAKDGQLVTISNTGNGILSLTNLKITYKTSGQTVTLSDLTAEEQANAVGRLKSRPTPLPWSRPCLRLRWRPFSLSALMQAGAAASGPAGRLP